MLLLFQIFQMYAHLARLHEGLSLGDLAGVVCEHPRDVGAQEQHGVAAHLQAGTQIMVSRLQTETAPTCLIRNSSV